MMFAENWAGITDKEIADLFDLERSKKNRQKLLKKAGLI